MALVQTGFSLIRTSDHTEIRSWSAHPASPPARVFVEGEIDAHGARVGDTFADGAYKLVERWADTPSFTAPWFSLSDPIVSFDGEKTIETYTLVGPNMQSVASAIKMECAKRVYAVASDNAQKNMLANYVAGNLSGEDETTFKDGTDWIMAMQATCRQLIVAADATYTSDNHWPAVPAGVAQLAARF